VRGLALSFSSSPREALKIQDEHPTDGDGYQSPCVDSHTDIGYIDYL
jgi:hypothetical protein